MIQTLENEHLKVSCAPKGAELQSIINKSTQVEYLWQGDPHYWGRRAPVLFPIVGALKEGKYFFDDAEYSLGQHGFARDHNFKVLASDTHSLKYQLRHSNETLKVFPFHFLLEIQYTLVGNILNVQYTVHNNGSSKMYFSIGAHPAFNCPLGAHSRRDECRIVFEKKEQAERQFLEGGVRTGETATVLHGTNELLLTDDLFDRDALIFQELSSNSITLNEKESPLLTMRFTGFPYLGIWSKNRSSPFVCLEPWYGIADHQDHSQSLKEKEGIIPLSSEEHFTCAFEVEFH
ncbi:MAG: aldose 1-epimerase family protein [Bacteroidota bacterium]